jgi:predicted nucleic acid-binding Zn ribbon protein
MSDNLGHWGQDKAIRVTWYIVGILAIVVSVWVSIHEILR